MHDMDTSQSAVASSPLHLVLAANELRLNIGTHSALLNGTTIRLRPKSFALLHHLMEHHGTLVTKEALLGALWPGVSVSPSALKVCIREIRQALGDDAEAPRFIRTVGRGLGYLFIPAVESESGRPQSPQYVPREATEPSLIGRTQELFFLHKRFAQASAGARQLVFVTGEAGIGKTSLVRAFTAEFAGRTDIRIAIGQCFEHSGKSEAYLPLLEALFAMCRQADGDRVRELLRRHAPTWLLQLPGLLEQGDHEILRRETIGTTPERMLREMAEALETLAAQTPLLLVLEDLHWSDRATVDMISYLGRRRQPARLLVLGLFRPDDALQQDHPMNALSQVLRTQQLCTELPLRTFSPAEVAAYLTGRLDGATCPEELAAEIWRRTQGNPLFVANVVEELSNPGPPQSLLSDWLAEVRRVVPESLRLLLAQRLRRLRPEEQRLLEAASVVGEEFTAAAAGAAAQIDDEQADAICERLVELRQFIGIVGLSEWPDGTVSGRYRFLHTLYRDTLLDRVMAARQVQYHRRVAQRLEAAYGDRADELLGELAVHFERGHMPKRAIHYLQRTASALAKRYANREAVAVLGRASMLLPQIREHEREPLQQLLNEQTGILYRSMGDIAASLEVFTALAAAAEKAGHARGQLRMLLYIADQLSWFDTERCLQVLQQAFSLSDTANDADGRLQARGYLGYIRATRVRWSDEDADACLAAARVARSVTDGVVAWPSQASHLLTMRSNYRMACAAAQEGLERALRIGDMAEYMTLHFNWQAGLFHLGELGPAIDVSLHGIEMAEKNDHALWAGVLRAALALCYEQSCAFTEARDVAEASLSFAQEDPAARKSLLQMNRCVLGFVYRGLGDPERSLQQLLALPIDGCQDLAVVSTRSYGLSECWLALGENRRAIEEARRLIVLMTPPGDRTLIALGHRVCARAAIAMGRLDQAKEEITKAIGILRQPEPSIASWRVLSTAAGIHRFEGRHDEARHCLMQSAAVLADMAESLRGHRTVRNALLANFEVREILAGTEPPIQR